MYYGPVLPVHLGQGIVLGVIWIAAYFMIRLVNLMLPWLILCAVSRVWLKFSTIQLCDGAGSTYGAARCDGFGGGCQGSYNANCFPYSIWQSTRGSEAGYFCSKHLAQGVFGEVFRPAAFAFSVRCVHGFEIFSVDSLQLCDRYESSKYGAAQCNHFIGSCQGAANTHCYPYDVWSSTVMDSEEYHRGFYLARGTLFGVSCDESRGKCLNTFTFSVRCVLGLSARYRWLFAAL